MEGEHGIQLNDVCEAPKGPRLAREVVVWLQGLGLSTPLRHTRLDFANGMLVAEILQKHFPKVFATTMLDKSFALEARQRNWQYIQQFCAKRSFAIGGPDIEGIVNFETDAAVKVITKLYTFLTNRPAAGQSHDEVTKLDEGDRIPCYKKLTASRMLKQSTVHTIADEEKNLKQTANLLKAYEAKKREEIRAKIEEKNTLYYLPRAAQTNDEFSEGQQRVKTRKKDYPGATEKTSWLSSLKIGIDTLTAMASAHQQNTNRTPDPDSLLLPAGSVEWQRDNGRTVLQSPVLDSIDPPAWRLSERRRSSGSSCCGSTISSRGLAAVPPRRPRKSFAGSEKRVVTEDTRESSSDTADPLEAGKLPSRDTQRSIEVKESARNAQKDEEKVEDIGTLKQRLVELLYLHLYDGGAEVEDELQRLLCQIDSKGSREQSASARRIIASFRDSDADHLAVANAVKTDKKIPET